MNETINYCPGCGQHVNSTYNYCPICGRCLRGVRGAPVKPIGPYYGPFDNTPWMVTSKVAPPTSVEYI